jgi:hypothetical protein
MTSYLLHHQNSRESFPLCVLQYCLPIHDSSLHKLPTVQTFQTHSCVRCQSLNNITEDGRWIEIQPPIWFLASFKNASSDRQKSIKNFLVKDIQLSLHCCFCPSCFPAKFCKLSSFPPCVLPTRSGLKLVCNSLAQWELWKQALPGSTDTCTQKWRNYKPLLHSEQ